MTKHRTNTRNDQWWGGQERATDMDGLTRRTDPDATAPLSVADIVDAERARPDLVHGDNRGADGLP